METERWEQVARLHREALELEESQRADFLREACGGDEHLRGEVESLLAYEKEGEGFMEFPALEAAARVLAREEAWPEPLSAGTRLGPYEIIAPIGAGGMGEVYRARDTRLKRDVAVKVLPADFAHDVPRRRRFEAEARAVAALNHPNILSVFDVGDDYMVTEIVDGASLRGASLTQRKTLEVVAQIADGLAAAHEAGMVHRDLKPDNVLLTRDGRVKILDFGLARVNAASATEETRTLTEPGTVWGTPGYMSPEQVRGSNVGHRSDIFSLGVILYELLAGKRAFGGESTADMLTAILREEPPELPDSVPLGLRQIVHRCLEKMPQERFQSARDLAFALRSLAGSTGSAKIVAAPARGRWWMPAAVVVLGALAVVFAVLWFTRPQGVDLSRYRYTPFATDAEPEINPSWSPDGRSIAYLKRIGREYQLMLRALDAPVPVQLTKMAEGAYGDPGNRPIWSPEGNRIYFIGGDPETLWSVGVAGGEPQEVFPGTLLPAASLSGDGKTLALWRVIRQEKKTSASLWISSPLGAPPRKYEPAPFEVDAWYTDTSIRFSPDRAHIGLGIDIAAEPEFWVIPWPEGHAAPRKLFWKRNLTEPPQFDWMPDAKHLLMAMEGSLWLGDSEKETLERLTTSPMGGDDTPAVSPDGRRIAFSTENVDFDIASIPLDGSPPQLILATARNEFSPSWSRSGRMAFITARSGQDEVWLRDARGDWERPVVTQTDFPNDLTVRIRQAAISPDGARVVYQREGSKSVVSLWISPASGGRPALVPTPGTPGGNGLAWSPDGKSLAFLGGPDGQQLETLLIGSDHSPTLLPARCGAAPAWSPDGLWIACAVRNERSILLISPDGNQSRKLASPAPTFLQDFVMVWSGDSLKLFVASSLMGDARLDAIDVGTGATRTIAGLGPSTSFEVLYNYCLNGSLAPDGKSFATTVSKTTSDIWILDGFAPAKRRWFSR
jgi:Tol biopolymer transport system component/predicted Ser/Thr protein kinase